ncbi:WD40-repeat-containing domain protein [Chiua virens]|nr:WD40-repeat-containing domain protein [Chiua virens]
MSLIQSSSLKFTNQSLHETSLPGDNYVISLSQIANLYAASASSPSNCIHLFDRASLQSTGVLKGHDHATTQLRTIHCLGTSTREMLLSSGKDGCVIAWDERSGSAGIKSRSFLIPGNKYLNHSKASSDTSGSFRKTTPPSLLRCKEDAFIVYWDPRNPAAQLRTHGSTHSDDVTAVHFLKSLSSNKVLLSTSSDGLINTSNALEADEDEAVMHVGNWGCSVSQGGWISDARGTRIWAASDMETFSCWSNDLDQLSAVDIRGPSLHDQGHVWVTDYLIKGHSTQKAESGLAVFVGSNEGDVALITGNNLSDTMTPWTIHSVWASGHSGIVRSLYWDEEHDVLVTGGEDAKITAWRIQTPGPADSLMSDQSYDPIAGLKREWDDTMDDNPTSSVGKRTRC